VDNDGVHRLRTQVAALHQRIRREAPTVDGLPRPALMVLAAAVRRPGLTPRDVADELRMTSSNVAASLRELEAFGFVDRGRDPADGRRVLLSPTADGRRVVAELFDERETWLGRAVAACLDDDEQRLLLRVGPLLERLASFEAAPAGSAPR
jgi:DNA-binding MarR family transcriptional regulator